MSVLWPDGPTPVLLVLMLWLSHSTVTRSNPWFLQLAVMCPPVCAVQTSLEPDRRRQVLTDLTGLKQDLQTLATSHQQLGHQAGQRSAGEQVSKTVGPQTGGPDGPKKPLAESSLLGKG